MLAARQKGKRAGLARPTSSHRDMNGGLVERAPSAPENIPHGPATLGARSVIATLNCRALRQGYALTCRK